MAAKKNPLSIINDSSHLYLCTLSFNLYVYFQLDANILFIENILKGFNQVFISHPCSAVEKNADVDQGGRS